MLNEDSGDTLLYDLQNDPYETQNLSSTNENVKKELLKAHNEWSGNNNEPLWPSMIYFYSEKDGHAYYFDQ
jgi:hypothetical protein